MGKKEIKESIKKHLKDNSKLNTISLFSKVFSKKSKEVDKSTEDFNNFQEIVSECKKEIKKSITIELEKEIPYQVSGDKYFWSTKNNHQITFPVELIDTLFYHYSANGLGLSQTQMLNKFNLKTWEWNSIKSRLSLTKLSHIFSPYTVENTPSEELGRMVEEKMTKLFSQVGYQVEENYNKVLYRTYKKKLGELTSRELQLQTIITELADLLPTIETRFIVKKSNNVKTKSITVHIADIHFGAENRTTNLPEYSPEITKEYLRSIAESINNYEAEEVHIFFEGDLIESFSGSSHPDSWKGIAKGYYGSKLVFETYRTLLEFVTSVYNVKSIYGVTGNHDRAESNNKLESTGEIGQIIYEFLRISLKEHNIPVIFNDRVISIEIDGIQHIMSHGDKKFTDLPSAEVILEYGKQGIYNLLTSGHWHQRKIKSDSKNFRHLVCPSLFVGNDFSVNLGFSTNPGFIITYNNGKGRPIVIDYSL